jgi:hypothetical protein
MLHLQLMIVTSGTLGGLLCCGHEHLLESHCCIFDCNQGTVQGKDFLPLPKQSSLPGLDCMPSYSAIVEILFAGCVLEGGAQLLLQPGSLQRGGIPSDVAALKIGSPFLSTVPRPHRCFCQ